MPEWIRARQCGNGACVEVKRLPFGRMVLVRSSLAPNRLVAFTRAEWDAFVQGVRNGDFDELGET